MARKRRNRRMGALSSLTFGAIPALPDSVNTKKLAMGLGVGLAGALAVRYAWNNLSFLSAYKTAALQPPDANGNVPNPVAKFLNDNLPAVGTILTAVAAYFLLKKKSPSDAMAIALGAAGAGAAVGGFALLQQVKMFQGLQMVKLGRHRYGAILTSDQNRPTFGALIGDASSAFVPGFNAPAGGRLGVMAAARRNPKMAALLAQHAALSSRSIG
jgi:hypothetical protein